MKKKYQEAEMNIFEMLPLDIIRTSVFVGGEDQPEGSDPYIHDFYD